ncbi:MULTISPECIES: hypothetical protein [Bacillales]|uniref:Uncharacterized protein n=1 Tax=Ureibacillus massiliensis 4400831 = CIP 108448 = CCUG 49529 TaxID=1211035 RepID=A0A0A3IYM7_9BACL|nr:MULTISPECIES: hypothetical protein [Bacillales]KGR89864.1 hypothetical protein CD30_14850 [Ureibacillus massiliensis 4400831 = CIP 108448 = CCUG 49529]
MGQYLQMGIGYRMEIDKKRLDKVGVTIEKLEIGLNKHFDMSLYEFNETHDKVIFEIKESVVLEQLQEFIQYQYSMYPQEQPYTDCFISAVEIIGGLSTFQEIVQVVEERNFPCFQSNRITDEIKVSAWDWLEIDISMFVFFVEGKIFMEGYNSLLKFIENNVRQSSEKWTIAGAFRCFIE